MACRAWCACTTDANWVDTKDQGVRFSSAPSGRIDPLSASSGIQVSLLGAMGDQPWGPWMQVPNPLGFLRLRGPGCALSTPQSLGVQDRDL